ncbi:uncharacterized protein [Littorina saxatilis]|uniref:THAP-type domain-containing protein n=1 Tax=Littorina saxatilis TaxID=31220 RepID=A0AAN9GIN7_9CAEN
MAFTCAIAKCSNGSYRLNKWKKEICPVHAAVREIDLNCDCEAPFCLWTIPTRKKKPAQRDKWKILINRVHPVTTRLLSPSKDQRVCSIHFKDGRPTANNPYPTQHLGYPQFEKKVKRVLTFEESANLPSTRGRGRRRETTPALPPLLFLADHTYFDLPPDIAAVEENNIVDDPEVEIVDDPELEIAVASEQQLGNHQLLLIIFTLFSVILLLINRMRSMFLQVVQALLQCAKLEKEVVELKSALEEVRKELRLKEESQRKPKVLEKKTKKKKTRIYEHQYHQRP